MILSQVRKKKGLFLEVNIDKNLHYLLNNRFLQIMEKMNWVITSKIDEKEYSLCPRKIVLLF